MWLLKHSFTGVNRTKFKGTSYYIMHLIDLIDKLILIPMNTDVRSGRVNKIEYIYLI